MLYKKNPLFTRFLYQIAFMSTIIGVCWFYFPLTMNKTSSGRAFCLGPESGFLADFDCISFQESFTVRGFFGFALIYVILSGLQIRYGEPINKGRRILMSETSMTYYFANKTTRSIPFFFTAAVCLDYMLTPTSLDFFEWIKFESIYNSVFESIYKIKSREAMIAGLRVDTPTKMIYGIGGLFV